MEILRHHGIDLTAKAICLIAAILMIIIAIAVFGADPLNLLVLVCYIVFYIQLPGNLILRALDIRPSHFSSLLCLGFFTGWAFIIAQYFISELIHTDLLLYSLGPICSAFYVFSILRDPSRTAKTRIRPANISTALLISMVIALFLSLAYNQYEYLSPTIDEMTYMSADKGFHIGLINSLSYGYPMEMPWLSDYYSTYHIFSEMLMCVPVRLFMVPADQVLLCFGPYLTTYAFGTSMYALLREMTGRKDRAGIYFLLVMLSNIFLARSITNSIAFRFIFGNENVAGYAISASFALMILIKYWYDYRDDTRRTWAVFIVMLAVMMLTTGIKGPFGIVMLTGMWGAFILGVILRKVSIKYFIPLMILSLGFLLIYLVVLGSRGQSGVDGSPFGLAKILNITFFKDTLILWMKSMGLPLIVRYAVLLLTFTVLMLTAFFIPFVAGYLRELVLVLTGRKEFYYPRVVVYASFLVGFMAMMLLRFHGRSQIYFGFIAVFFATLIAIWFFEDMEQNKGYAMKAVRIVFAASIVFCAFTLGSQCIGLIGSAIHSSDPTVDNSRYMSVSKDEYEAMRWINDNTPEDSVIATDRYYSRSPEKYEVANRWDNRFFLYADYSNRICYLAGTGYILPSSKLDMLISRIETNDRLYDPGNDDRGKLAKELGVSYLVVSKDFTGPVDLSNDDYKICYSNDDVDVYEIK